MNWESVSWKKFETELWRYKGKFFDSEGEEKAYIKLMSQLKGISIPNRDTREVVEGIVTFLNKWQCRLSRNAAVPAISKWIRHHAQELESVGSLAIDQEAMLERAEELGHLYSSLLDLKSGPNPKIHNMSDAAASKVLHAMQPRAFVMWDLKIKRHFPQGYPQFLRKMHVFGQKLNKIAPLEAKADAETYLNARLKYPIQKTLAKLIDEYNWYVEVGCNW